MWIRHIDIPAQSQASFSHPGVATVLRNTHWANLSGPRTRTRCHVKNTHKMYGTQHGACGYWRRNIIWNVWNQKLVCGKFFQSSEMQNCEQKIWFLLMPNKNRSSLLLRKYTQWCSTYNYKCTVHFFPFWWETYEINVSEFRDLLGKPRAVPQADSSSHNSSITNETRQRFAQIWQPTWLQMTLLKRSYEAQRGSSELFMFCFNSNKLNYLYILIWKTIL